MTVTEDRVAASVAVGRVIRSGAWSNVVSRIEAESAGADVSTVQGLVFGVLRNRPLIDNAIASHASRPIEKIDDRVLDLLRVATAELMADRTPMPLVVDGLVHAVRLVSPRAAGFANAVMRRMSENVPRAETLADIGIPEFVDSAMRHVLDPADVDAFWLASQQPAPVGLRSERQPDGARRVDGIPGAWLWDEGAPPEGVAVQDPASVAVVNAVALGCGGCALDIAAAPGGKTQHLVDQAGETGRVIGMDIHPRRVRDAALRVPQAIWVVGDGRSAPFAESTFDAVLVDAPCTGLGTLRRRPEIRDRVSEAGMAQLAAIQRSLLDEALRLVRPGGRVVYSVCTITPAETIDVVAGLGGVPPSGLPGVRYGDGWLMGPHLGPTDGMFVTVIPR
ncbi:MAG: RsmB/NOP family class I SAM-dependent RNA methyltransferase [Acidimicrobiia bacterium]